jgi:hypothetical protein
MIPPCCFLKIELAPLFHHREGDHASADLTEQRTLILELFGGGSGGCQCGKPVGVDEHVPEQIFEPFLRKPGEHRIPTHPSGQTAERPVLGGWRETLPTLRHQQPKEIRL